MRTLLAVLLLALPASAAELTLTTGREKAGAFTISGRDTTQQLLVTATDGKPRDVTPSAKYTVAPAGIVTVDATGLVSPLKEGKATITAAFDGKSAKLIVTVTHLNNDLPVSFANEVVPVFTKFGCNAGGCHGKASGQNGFKLSLLGFYPEEDHEYLVKEGRGRRLLPSSPENSLLLQKAAGQVPHGGGKKLDPSSPFYRLLVRWVAQGAPYGSKDDPTVTAIEAVPSSRILPRGGKQQLAVVAKMSDGTTRDVTRMAQYEANQADMADVSETGLVTIKQVPGRAAIMVRFQSHVAVFGATVPMGAKIDKLPPERTFIDKLVFKQWKELGLPPSAEADDGTFLRRVTIDLCGRLPTPTELKDFIADKSAEKHEKLVDRLLASKDHADHFTSKWSNLLRNRRSATTDNTAPTFAFHAWIRESIEKNKPYDQFVREVLTATGEEVKVPAVVWYRELKEPDNIVEDASQLFLGQRIGCAKCHHHPFEKWSQDDYYGLVSFFSRVEVKIPAPPKKKKPKKGEKPVEEPFKGATVSLSSRQRDAVNPRTKKPVPPTGLGGDTMPMEKEDDPRAKFAEWMTAKDNPFFAKALANRYWKHFMGRGLVDPEDDMRATNPASNPELLDALAKSFVESKYDMRKYVRMICLSTVYRLSAVPNEHNAKDRQSYSRFLPRRLHAEVLLDSIDGVTGSKTSFKGVPSGTRAVQLPDNLFDSYFLSVFGRPDAASACECERSGDSSLAQALHMINSKEIQTKVSAQRARDLTRDKRPLADKLRDLYILALSREPTKEELKALTAYLEKKGAKQEAWEDVLWALINTKEFLYNH
jgi:hypothetical protein